MTPGAFPGLPVSDTTSCLNTGSASSASLKNKSQVLEIRLDKPIWQASSYSRQQRGGFPDGMLIGQEDSAVGGMAAIHPVKIAKMI